MNEQLKGRVQARQQASSGGNGSPSGKAEVERRALSDVHTLLESMKPEIAKTLPRHLTPDRLARIVYTEARKESRLAYCTAVSLAGAVLTCAQLGLEPGSALGEVWLVPRKNKEGQLEATFQLGYKGMASLFWRHPAAQHLDMQTVYANDEFDYGLGLDPYLIHKPPKDGRPRGERKGYWYAVAKLTNGGFRFCVLNREEVEAHRQRSDAPNSPAWRNDFDTMAGKTCVRVMFGLMPKSMEAAKALQLEGSVRTDLSADVLDIEPPDGDVIDGVVVPDDTPEGSAS